MRLRGLPRGGVKDHRLYLYIRLNGGFIAFSLLRKVTSGFPENSPEIYNGGEAQFSTTSLPTVGAAVMGLLPHPEETRNRAVCVAEALVSQNYLLSLVKKAAPKKPWAPVDLDLGVVAEEATGRFSTSTHCFPTIIEILLKSTMHPSHGSKFVKNDNELLRMKPATEEYLTELIDPVVPASDGQ